METSNNEATKKVESTTPSLEHKLTFKEKFSNGLKTAKKVTIRIIIVSAILAITGFWIYASMNFSEGERVGKVVKISKKGIFFKTYEGQLNFEDNRETWDFSIPKSQEQVRINIEQAVENNKRVKLFYKQKYITLPWRGDSDYLVYQVEILNK